MWWTTHRDDLERRRATVRAVHRTREVAEACVRARDRDSVVAAVAAGLADVLALDGCWFEPGPSAGDLPELRDDGEASLRVQARGRGGAVLPALIAVPVAGATEQLGRFVLESRSPDGVSIERRVLAFTMAQLVAVSAAVRAG